MGTEEAVIHSTKNYDVPLLSEKDTSFDLTIKRSLIDRERVNREVGLYMSSSLLHKNF